MSSALDGPCQCHYRVQYISNPPITDVKRRRAWYPWMSGRPLLQVITCDWFFRLNPGRMRLTQTWDDREIGIFLSNAHGFILSLSTY